MKKILAILMALLLCLSLFGCEQGKEEKQEEAQDGKQEAEVTDEEVTNEGESLTLENIKVGFVHISDPSDMGYTYNHDLGTQKMMETLGLSKDQIINQFNVKEGASCETAIRECAEQGCNLIFITSFGFEDYAIKVAKDYPEIEFCHATGYKAKSSGLPNMHNYFGKIYEARYLSGIAAGLATTSNKLGYVAAMPYAECISGFDAFFLGAKSVNPDVEMVVMYTMSWNDPTKEAQVTQALINQGCDVIGQHCDSTAPATTAEANGVLHVGYNSDMTEAAPNASITSAVWDWSRYLIFAINSYLEGKEIPVDWSEGLAEGVCDITPLSKNAAPGTAEKIEEAKQAIINGELEVFAGPLKDNEGNIVVEEGDVYVDEQSAPAFDKVLEGITVFD
ncbi:MAG: BMP family ABC transporter substrate-binding protein [Eubacteriales bacterium]|nr:BMP family ABC transporter substrate-binding protein [Eubacteriales bacterium]